MRLFKKKSKYKIIFKKRDEPLARLFYFSNLTVCNSYLQLLPAPPLASPNHPPPRAQCAPTCSGQVLKVVQVFVSAAGFFIDFKIFQADQVDFHPIYRVDYSRLVTIIKLHTGDLGCNFKAQWGDTHSNDLIFF